MTETQQAFFMPAVAPATGQRFCVFHPARGPEVHGLVVYIHPFAEEMNKSRRMAALQSRSLAAAGFSVLQIDLHGCGDSSGDFGDACWHGWVDDVLMAVDWLRRREAGHAHAPLWFWGLRAGCLLALAAAAKLDEACNFCFWQPVITGKLALQQFLRLEVAANLLSGNSQYLMNGLRQQIARGESVAIAGYQVASALAQGLNGALLKPCAALPSSTRLEWFEVSTRSDTALSPMAEQMLAQWIAASAAGRSHLVQGPLFWQTSEIEDAPALIAATTAALTLTAPPVLRLRPEAAAV